MDHGRRYAPMRPAPPGRSLRDRYPAIAAELHPDLNDDLTAETIWAGTMLKVWWRCESGHDWQATVSSRVRGSGCPVCAPRRPATGRSLAELHPDLAEELHPERNDGLEASSLSAGSNRIVWWRCRHGHEWQARIFGRTGGSGCPVCARARVATSRSLAVMCPTLGQELHPDRNGEIDPYEVAGRSNRLVWWRCSRGHEWEARVSDRAAGNGCPYCYRDRRNAARKRG